MLFADKVKYFQEILQCAFPEYVKEATALQKAHNSQIRSVLRNFVFLSSELKQLEYSFSRPCKNIKYIYRLEACNLRYIGQTNDPLERFTNHIGGNDNKGSGILVQSAMDNNLVPQMEILDICDDRSKFAIEGYWMSQFECVNKQRNLDHLNAFLKEPEKFRSVVAHRLMGKQPTEFKELLPDPTFLPIRKLKS